MANTMAISTQDTRDPSEGPLTHSHRTDRVGVENHVASGVRVGAVAYLNTKPLIYGLQTSLAGFGSLHLDLPSRLATSLEKQVLDVGLIPVVEYLRNLHRYRVVSDAIIACRGPVWSVRIFFRKDPADVRRLAIDEGSRSSVALSKVLFHARFGTIPETQSLPIAASPETSQADAVLVIGDRAMHPERYRHCFATDWDLGQEWFVETGLPFVFAMWVARASRFATPALAYRLEQSRNAGCDHVDQIVDQYASDYELTPVACRDYLTKYLRFQLGPDELAGLTEYHRRCMAIGLTPSDLPS